MRSETTLSPTTGAGALARGAALAMLGSLLAAVASTPALAAAPAGVAAESPQAEQTGFAFLVGPSLLSSDLTEDLGRDHVLANGFVMEAAARVRGPLYLIVELARHAEPLDGLPGPGRHASQTTLVVGVGYRPDGRGAWRPILNVAVGRASARVDVRVDLPFVGRLPIVSHGFAATLGVGAERRLGEAWAWRVLQFDVVVTDYFDSNADVRLTSGISVRF